MKFATLTRALPVLLFASALAACAPNAPQTAAPTAAPVTAPSATPELPSGNVYTFNGVRVTLPAAVASGANGRIVPAAQEEGAPNYAIHPAYTEIALSGYPAQHAQYQGMIQVFAVADYEQALPMVEQRVQALQALLAAKPAVSGEEIPVLPVFNEAQILRAQVQYADFENGAGVRCVTMYAQGLVPATNRTVFYTYQGLTADGAYWVSAILPVNAGFLPADDAGASEPPAGGVPFPAELSAEQVKAYYQAVADKMDAAPTAEFTPSLEALDAMMQSLRVTAP
ncbi:MAG: hypothetical protein ACUVX9_00900 [Anaerolineae bacterium]